MITSYPQVAFGCFLGAASDVMTKQQHNTTTINSNKEMTDCFK